MSFFQRKKPRLKSTKVERPGGLWLDSRLEGALYDLLASWQRLGIISGLHHHPGTIFLSDARIQYRPDFTFLRVKSQEREWAEAKGFANDKWPIKKKLWRSYGPGILHIYGGSYKYLKLIEIITPEKNQ